MSMPNVMISDLLEPHACLTFAILQPRLDPLPILKSCCKPSTREPFMGSTITSSPLFGLELVPNRPADFNLGLLSPFLSTRALPFLFHTPSLPFPVLPYYHFIGTSHFFQVRSHYRISCRPRITLFSDGKHRYLRKDGLPLATQHDPMTKKLPTGTPPKQPLSNTERRGSRRCKITQLMRIRPSDPNKERFEDMRSSVSVSRSGIFFQSSERGYEVGMRLFVTMPYSQDPASIAREYLAEVVRRDVLPTGMFGIGIKILMEMGVQHSYNFGAANSR